MSSSENTARDRSKESRTATWSAPRTGASAYTRRRRARAAVAATPAAATLLQRYWDEHAIKTGILGFWLWFGLANWKGLQQVSVELGQRLMG